MNYLDLFSGIGAFHKGLLEAGFHFNWTGFSEVDDYASSVYRNKFPQAKELGDAAKINTHKLPRIDLITFGWPCQDLSIAGKRGGIQASRSGLFFEAIRIIRDTRPTYFIAENVKGLLSSKEGADFTICLQEITNIGYDCQWQLLNTVWFLPQHRERIYIVGHIRGQSRPKVFPIEEGVRKSRNGSKDVSSALDANYWKGPSKGYGGKNRQLIQVGDIGSNAMAQRVYSTDGASVTLRGEGGGQGGKTGLYCSPSLHGFGHGWQGYHNQRFNVDGVRRLTPVECERLQGLPDKWTEKGIKDGKTIDISDTQRYKMLGNAVSVPVVKEVARRLRT